MSTTHEKTKKELLAEMKIAALEETYNEITSLRTQTLEALKDLDAQDILGSYKHTLTALVRKAGKAGISLAEVKTVLPDVDILQLARNELGSKSYIISKGTPGEEEKEGAKVIMEDKGQTKGNTVTFYPGENVNLGIDVNNDSDTKVVAEG